MSASSSGVVWNLLYRLIPFIPVYIWLLINSSEVGVMSSRREGVCGVAVGGGGVCGGSGEGRRKGGWLVREIRGRGDG